MKKQLIILAQTDEALKVKLQDALNAGWVVEFAPCFGDGVWIFIFTRNE